MSSCAQSHFNWKSVLTYNKNASIAMTENLKFLLPLLSHLLWLLQLWLNVGPALMSDHSSHSNSFTSSSQSSCRFCFVFFPQRHRTDEKLIVQWIRIDKFIHLKTLRYFGIRMSFTKDQSNIHNRMVDLVGIGESSHLLKWVKWIGDSWFIVAQRSKALFTEGLSTTKLISIIH